MKKVIYLASWAVLTATDAILGFKTAVSDFGITDTTLAIIWALGFSLLSVPLKVIYERVIEKAYQRNTLVGQSIFLVFSVFWLFVCFNAYTGISELRKKDMQRLQIECYSKQELKPAIVLQKIESNFEYKLARKAMIYQAKQDSLILQSQLAEQKLQATARRKLNEQSTGNGFLYFNLLLILSASICLSLGLDETPIKATTKPKTVEPYTLPVQEEIIAPQADNKPKNDKLVVNPAMAVPYRCDCCATTFQHRYAYNGHLKNSTCERGKFTKLIIT